MSQEHVGFDYQLDRHCSKTKDTPSIKAEIQSEVNKAGKGLSPASKRQIYTGVLDRYYSKTLPKYGFDYITRNKGYNYNR